MLALCPDCGHHHEVVRSIEQHGVGLRRPVAGQGEASSEVLQIAPLGECAREFLDDAALFEAQAKFGQEAIIDDDEEEG